MSIHRIWLGSEMPERYKEYGEMWAELNPAHDVHDWTEEEIFDTDWTNAHVLNDLLKNAQNEGADLTAYYTQVADVIDYEILYREGGWYFNTDLKPIKSLSTLTSEQDYWAYPALAMEDDIHPVNMAMYAPPGEERRLLYKQIIEALPGRYFSMPGAFMNATTGVQLLQQVLRTHTGPVVYYDRKVFNPIHWSEVRYGEYPDEKELPEETVAVHEWLHRTNQRNQRVLEL